MSANKPLGAAPSLALDTFEKKSPENHLSPEHERATALCQYCPRLCRDACPVATASAREALTPKFKMQIAGELRDEAPTMAKAELLWGCSDCGACESHCLHQNPVGKTLYETRAHIVERGVQPNGVKGARLKFGQHLNPFGEALPVDPALLQPGHHSSKVLLVGCRAPHTSPDWPARLIDWLRTFDPHWQLGAMPYLSQTGFICCGRTLKEAGDVRFYEAHQREVAQVLAPFHEWIVLDPTCLSDFENLRDRAASLTIKPQVLSLAEWLNRMDVVPHTRLPSATLQIACGLQKSPEALQSMLRLARKVTDELHILPKGSQFSGCCGGRGGIKEVMPEVATRMAMGHWQELQAAAPAVISTSFECHSHLMDQAHSGSDLRVLWDFFVPKVQI